MKRRKRAINSAKIERWIKEGRGQFKAKDYKAWLEVKDVASIGLSGRQNEWKTGRAHHVLSNHERSYFHYLEWSPYVVDIREQFPLLPLSKTLEIAERICVKHPTDPDTQESIVMTTDFLITVDIEGEKKDLALTVKHSTELKSSRIIEKLEIERSKWPSRYLPQQLMADRGEFKGDQIKCQTSKN